MLNYMQFLISWILKYCKLTFIREQKKNRWEIYTMFNEFIVDLLNCKCFFFLLLALLKCLLYQLLCSMIANLQIFLETFPCLLNIPARFYITGIYIFFFIYIFLQGLYNTTCHFKLFTVYNLTYFLWYISILESLFNKYIG